MWKCEKCGGIQDETSSLCTKCLTFRRENPGQQKPRPGFWKRLFARKTSPITPKASNQQKRSEPSILTIGKCDVCGAAMSHSDGYVITATQALTAPGYWEYYFTREEIKKQTVSSSQEDKIVEIAVMTMMFGSGSGFMVCEQCSSRFSFDRVAARQCAVSGRQPKSSGRPEIGDVFTVAKSAWQKLKKQSSNETASGERWYFAADNVRGLRQIVFELGGAAPADSCFGNLFLRPDKYSGLINDVSVGFFKTDSKPGPYLLIKTPRFSRAMAREAVRLGFTFCFMPSGPVFAVFAESPTTERELKGARFIDQVYSMDKHSGLVDLIIESFSKETLTTVFADSGAMTAIQCVQDVNYSMERSLRERFDKEWARLVSHGNYTRGWGAGSFAATRDELYARTPTNESSILQR